MGFREAVLFGFVFLLSGGNVCATTQNFSTNETLNQIPQKQATSSFQLQRSRQSNRTEHGDAVRPPVSYRLRTYELRNPAVSKQKQPHVEQMQTPHNPQTPEAGRLTSEQLELREAVQAPELPKLLLQGPDLNPPVKPEAKVLVKFEQRVPVAADSVAVRCGEGEVTVEVKQNFLGNGQLIRPSDLTLGGCAALDAAAATDRILQFQTDLPGCSSTLTMTEDALIYSLSLMYSPTPISNTVVLKTSPAEVVIQCHYRRRHYVSSNAVSPTWRPFASGVLAERQLHFSLRLMTEDWQSQRPSSVYFPSDVMHIEAAVLQGHHVPLRVYVDSCVATAGPDPYSQPRYPFINNHGCLRDAKLTGAKSYFMQRSREDKLHFQLKAFRFHQDHRNSLYITCHLKATTVSVPVDSQHKACSFLTEANRWVASGGDNKVCSCCETSCSEQRRRRRLAADAGGVYTGNTTFHWGMNLNTLFGARGRNFDTIASIGRSLGISPDLQWEGTAALGPILLEESILDDELAELSERLPDPARLLQTHEVTRAASFPSAALLCGAGAALVVVLLVFFGAVICSRLHKPTGHAVCT